MARASIPFQKDAIKRAVAGALAGGWRPARVRIDPDGAIEMFAVGEGDVSAVHLEAQEPDGLGWEDV